MSLGVFPSPDITEDDNGRYQYGDQENQPSHSREIRGFCDAKIPNVAMHRVLIAKICDRSRLALTNDINVLSFLWNLSHGSISLETLVMKNNISLSIPTPCTEKWSDFTSTAQGGFCSACQKEVIDFTQMSDSEILNYISGKHARVCGKFRPEQLKNYALGSTSIKPGFALLKVGLVSVMMLLVSKPVAAQLKTSAPKTEIIKDEHTKGKILITENQQSFPVRGKVISVDDNSPLPGVNVVVKGTTIGTVTNENGVFEFQALKGGDILVFSFIGYTSKEHQIKEGQSNEINVDMIMYPDIMGELLVDGQVYSEPVSQKMNWWERLKSKF
jgi:hypothetical protein